MSIKSSLLSSEMEPDVNCIELDITDEKSALRRRVDTEERNLFHQLESEKVKTRKGDIHVAIQGDRNAKRTAIVTLHDIGQNHVSCFQSIFCFHQFKPLLNNFTVYHLNFPGQEEDAEELPEDYIYPTMEEMADVVEEVFAYYNLRNTICFGVGAGANVFIRLGLKDPKHVECLILVNPIAGNASWSDWGHEKVLSHYLKTKGMTQFCQDYLLYHFLGKFDESTKRDLADAVRDDLRRIKHPRNLSLLIEAHAKRSNIKMNRPVAGQSASDTLKCGVLMMTGDHSPAVDDTVALNAKLDPTNSTWIKIADATSMVLEEQPTGVTNAIVLFLQGYGHAMKMRPPALSFTGHEQVEGPPAVC